MGKSGSNKNRVGMFIGGALVVVAVIAWISIDGFPPSFIDTAGTIGAAKKYQAEQISEADVVLEDQAIQALLQNDEFVRMVSDEKFQAMPRDAKMQELTRNLQIGGVMNDALLRYRDAEFLKRAKVEFEYSVNPAQALDEQLRNARLKGEIDQYLAAPEKWFENHKMAYRDVELARRDAELARRDAELARRDVELARRDAEFARILVARDLQLAGRQDMILDKVSNARLKGEIDQYLASPEKWCEANKMAYRDVELARRDAEFARILVARDVQLAGRQDKIVDELANVRLKGEIDQYLASPEKWCEANKMAYRDVELARRDAEFARTLVARDVQLAGRQDKIVGDVADMRLAALVDQYLAAPEKVCADLKMAHLTDLDFLVRGVVDRITNADFQARLEKADQ